MDLAALDHSLTRSSLSFPSSRFPSIQNETENSASLASWHSAPNSNQSDRTDSHAWSNHPAYSRRSSTAECHRPNPAEPTNRIDPETPPQPQSRPQEQF